MMRTTRPRPGSLGWVLPLVALMAAPAFAAPAVRVETAEFPTIRTYVQGKPDWKGAKARVVFTEPTPPSLFEALEELEARRVAAEDPSVVPDALDPPVDEIPATIVDFEHQTRPGEGMLLVLLVDDTASMPGAPIERVVAAVSKLVKRLRPQDKVAVIGFSDATRVVLKPTAKAKEAVDAVRALTLGGQVTRIFNAMNETVSADIPHMRKTLGPAFPTRPHQRVLVVFSDGMDETSRVTVADLREKLANLEKQGQGLELFTVGVGTPTKKNPDPHADLERLALVAASGPNKVKRFFDQPDPAALGAAYGRIVELLADELRVDFELPIDRWLASETKAELRFTVGTEDKASIPLTLTAGALANDKRVEAEARKTALDAVVTWLADSDAASEKNRKLKLYGGIGAGVLLLAILILVLMRRSMKRGRAAQELAIAGVNEDLTNQLATMKADLSDREKALDKALEGQFDGLRKAASEQSRVALASLLVVDGPMKGQRYAITKTRCIAGRDPECDIRFPPDDDRGISRQHVEFRQRPDGMWEALCMSEGGMGVNGRGVRHGEAYQLQIGDQVQLGSSTFRFEGPV